jgi:hypothetical protein
LVGRIGVLRRFYIIRRETHRAEKGSGWTDAAAKIQENLPLQRDAGLLSNGLLSAGLFSSEPFSAGLLSTALVRTSCCNDKLPCREIAPQASAPGADHTAACAAVTDQYLYCTPR